MARTAHTPHWPGAVLAWALGLALQLQQPVLWPAAGYAGCAALGGGLLWALCGGCWRWRVRARWGPLACAVLAWPAWAALGWAMAGLHACWQPAPIDPALEGRDIDLVGRVSAMVQPLGGGWRFRFEVEQAHLRGQPVALPRQLMLGWYAASSGAAGDPPVEPMQPGERWRMRVRLKAAHGHINPGGFDYELWLWEQGIRATGYVRQGPHDPAPERLAQTGRHPLEWWRQRVRERLVQTLADSGPESVAPGVLAALVTGDQGAIERGAWEVFRVTGVAHLMSISGLHVTMLGWLAARLLAALWRRSARWGWRGAVHWPTPVVAAWGGLAVAAGYALFSGWGVPAQRTVCMLAVVTLLRTQALHWSAARIWASAGVVVLAADPWAGLQPGFWLSFVAVGVLLASGPPAGGAVPSERWTPESTSMVHSRLHLGGALRALLVPLRALLREQWTVSLALAPLGLLFFGQFSVVGLLVNVLAIPWVSLLVTPLALLGVLWPGAWWLAALAVQPLMASLQWAATLPWASLWLVPPPWPLAALALLGALGWLLRGPWAWRLWALPLWLPALLWQPPRPVPGQFELLAADVGQGNAVLVRTARHSLLYDTGPRYSPESDAGHRVLLPLLAQQGERLDVLMLSHRDSDHTGGAAAVLSRQPQVVLWSSLEDGHPLTRLARADGQRRCEAGQRWQWDGVQFEVLHPAPGAERSATRANALSCVLRLQAQPVGPGRAGASALLAGDIEAAQERALLEPGLAPVDWLLVPHHGSRTSSSAEFLEALQPRWALVQAGYRNRFGHPAPDVVGRYQARGIALRSSPDCGAARWRSEDPDRLRCERQAGRRYWHHAWPPPGSGLDPGPGPPELEPRQVRWVCNLLISGQESSVCADSMRCMPACPKHRRPGRSARTTPPMRVGWPSRTPSSCDRAARRPRSSSAGWASPLPSTATRTRTARAPSA